MSEDYELSLGDIHADALNTPDAVLEGQPDQSLGDSLICFSHLRWNFVYQRPQHLMSRFAKKMRVYFWEEPIPVWEAPSTGAGAPTLLVDAQESGVTVLKPVLPEGISGADAIRMQGELLRSFIRAENIKHPVFWFYTPFLLDITRHLKPSLVIYDCMDELSAFRFAPPDLRRREAKMLSKVDLVFTGGYSLYEAKRDLHPSVHAFPSSVDAAHFRSARLGMPEPEDQANIPHPRLGFFGVIDERLDQGLLARLASMRPDWQFVVIGPVVKVDAELLPRRDNIHYLGSKAYADLPQYVSGWKVALMPFAMNEATRFISPTKTPEYLAAGLTVVSTPIADVVRTYGDLTGVAIAATAEEFVAACDTALALSADMGKWRPQADRLLEAGSWEKTWASMVRLMHSALAEKHSRSAKQLPNKSADVSQRPTLKRLAGDALFASFFMGGFEGSTHQLPSGRRLDMIARTKHDRFAESDYELMQASGLLTIRDAVRWHLIEAEQGVYDWSSFLPMLKASQAAGLQVIWDLCHYGVPDHIDIWSPNFIDRYAKFCAAAATLIREGTVGPTFYCPMNEISYWAWAGGSEGKMYPAKRRRGGELKRQLARAAIAAIDAVRVVDPLARFIHAEPLINVVGKPTPKRVDGARGAYHYSQFEAYDMIAGRLAPELGGSEAHLDIIGSNYYHDNQWMESGEKLGFGHPMYRPLSDLLTEVHARYQRPILLSETGAEGRNGPAWLRYVSDEARNARLAGVPVEGLCLYPVMDYPGWSNARHCRCGLIELDASYERRSLEPNFLAQLQREKAALRVGDRKASVAEVRSASAAVVSSRAD